MLKKVTQHTLLYSISPQVPRLVNFFLLPVLTTFLTTSDYGIYGIVLAYTMGLGALKELGLTICIVNVFTNHPTRWKFIWERLFGFLVIWSVIFVILQTVLLFFIIPDHLGVNKSIIIYGYALVGLFLDIPLVFGQRYFQLKEKSTYIAFVTTFIGIISVLSSYYTIAVLKMGYLGWFVSIFSSSVLSFCFYAIPLYYYYNFRPVCSFSIKFIKRYLTVALPTIPHNYSSYLYNASDRIILERSHLNLNDIGKYNFAYTFGSYVEMFNGALGMAIGPLHLRLFAKKSKDAHETVKKLTFFFQASFLVGAFILCLWLKEIFSVLVNNPELAACYPYAIFIIMGYSYAPMYFSSVNLLFYHEKTSQLWKISFIGGVINVLLNIIFIPFFGVYASIAATFIALMYIGYAGYFMQVYKSLSKVNYHPVIWISVTFIIAALAYILMDSNWIAKIVITCLMISGYGIYLKKNISSLVKPE